MSDKRSSYQLAHANAAGSAISARACKWDDASHEPVSGLPASQELFLLAPLNAETIVSEIGLLKPEKRRKNRVYQLFKHASIKLAFVRTTFEVLLIFFF
jgi:hypothetical protein